MSKANRSDLVELHLNVFGNTYTVEAEEPLDGYRDYDIKPHLKRRAVVHLFCRDKDRKRRHVRDWRGKFKPYLYVPSRRDNKEGMEDFKKRFVKRVETTLPGEVPSIRARFKFTDEAAILFEKRFLIDHDIYCGIKVTKHGDAPAIIERAEPLVDVPPRICYYDVEMAAEGDVSPLEANYPVVLIQSLDSYTEKITVHLQRPPNIKVRELKVIIAQIQKVWKERGFEVEVVDCPNEFQTINMWIQYIRDKDFDVLTAHNGDRFDFPYLFYRCRNKNWRIFRRLSPLNRAHMRGEYPYIQGREHIDFCGMKKKRDGFYTNFTVQDTDVDSLRLEELAETDLNYHYRFGKIGHLTSALWNSNEPRDIFKLIYYGCEDAWVMYAIDQKKGMTLRYETIRRIFGSTLRDTLSNERLVDTGCLRLTEAPLPTKVKGEYKGKGKKREIEGAIVISPKAGIHGDMPKNE
jgi:DNA polymerase elongation subunit (family B)